MDSAKFIKETNDIFGFELEEPSPSSIRELTDNLRGRKNTTSSIKKNIAETFNERKHMLENKKMAPPKLVSFSDEIFPEESKYDKEDMEFQLAIKLSLKENVDKNKYLDENEKLKKELEELKREREEEKRKVFDNLQKKRDREEEERKREKETKKMLEILRKEREEQEEQKQLEEIYKSRREYANNIISSRDTKLYNTIFPDIYLSHTMQNQVILYEIRYSYENCDSKQPSCIIIITNTGLYQHSRHNPSTDGRWSINNYICGPIYLFTKPLTLKHAKLIQSVMENGAKINTVAFCKSDSSYPEKRTLESVIRLIPGGYKNVNWRQLDGFFGMYYNDVTNELSHVPPVLVKVKKEEWTCPDDDCVHLWTFKGKNYYRNYSNELWEVEEDMTIGDWVGMYIHSDNRIDDSVAEPYFEEE